MDNLAIVLALVSVSFVLMTICVILFGIEKQLMGIKIALQQLDEPPVRKV